MGKPRREMGYCGRVQNGISRAAETVLDGLLRLPSRSVQGCVFNVIIISQALCY